MQVSTCRADLVSDRVRMGLAGETGTTFVPARFFSVTLGVMPIDEMSRALAR